jgi:hypothetical protein
MTEQEKNNQGGKPTRPLDYKVYKGMGGRHGCFQFSLLPAYWPGAKRTSGAVFIEAAPAIGKNVYDWENKTTFALGINDIGTVLTGFKQGKFEIFHDPGAKTEKQGAVTKRLTLATGEVPGSFFLTLVEKEGDNQKRVSIPLASHEARILCTLLEAAVPKVLGW